MSAVCFSQTPAYGLKNTARSMTTWDVVLGILNHTVSNQHEWTTAPSEKQITHSCASDNQGREQRLPQSLAILQGRGMPHFLLFQSRKCVQIRFFLNFKDLLFTVQSGHGAFTVMHEPKALLLLLSKTVCVPYTPPAWRQNHEHNPANQHFWSGAPRERGRLYFHWPLEQ